MSKKHRFIWSFLRPPVGLVMRVFFGYRYKLAKNLPENYIVLSNHTTDFDPVLVGLAFKKQMYLVASEHITRWGFPYKLLKYAFEPIIRYKATVATSTVLDILRKVRKGERVCMFAEGVKSWDGVTCPMFPATAQMIKKSGCALVTFKLKGGYFVSPAWGKGLRRGKWHGGVENVYTKEQLAEMSYDEIEAVITKDLYEDAYQTQLAEMNRYKGKSLASGLENILWACPECKSADKLVTKGNKIICTQCKKEIEYDKYAMLSGCDFKTVYEYSEWQRSLIEEYIEKGKDITCENIRCQTITKESSELLFEGKLVFSGDSVSFGDNSFEWGTLTDLAIHGKHALVFEANKKYYELIFPEGISAYKFLIYYKEAVKRKERV
ncbi:MAG: 1-acyl-sn-glycerol-3-phosphate acyltransferase [Ruminococcaceae bacterium]|nr:1-acyl-sn-glycerol-3-phosphate acyltransferase [Oscillospiraceae bacterium]